MIARVVDVSHPGHLRLEKRHLVVEQDGKPVGRVPLEDLGILLLDGPQITVSNDLLAGCADGNIAVLISDSRHLPASMLLPFVGNALAGKVMRQQVEASLPTKKLAWQQTVSAKLKAQAAALESCQDGLKARRTAQRLRELAAEVKSGDPENREAIGAALYFPALFGADFVRDRDCAGTNRLLNYGYAILRAATARALVGAGLHPAFGVNHRNQYDAFTLADDAMEPLRPLVDLAVYRAEQEGNPAAIEWGPPIKRQLIEWIHADIVFAKRTVPFMTGLHYYAAGWRRVLCDGGRKLSFPTGK